MKNDLLARDETSTCHSVWPLFIVFTTVQNTLLSLQALDRLTSDLATRIQLLVPDHAKHSGALVTPMMLADFTARYFLTMIPHTGNFEIQLTRYPAATEDLWEVLPPQSLIVLAGTSRRFWPSAEQRFARQLQQAGHEVIFFSTQSPVAGLSVPVHAKHEPGRKKSVFDFLKLRCPSARSPKGRI